MSYCVMCYAVAEEATEKKQRQVKCFVAFENPESHYKAAADYFVWRYADGEAALKGEPWLAKQPHVIGEALIVCDYFMPLSIRLRQPNSSVVPISEIPSRAPEFQNGNTRIWVDWLT